MAGGNKSTRVPVTLTTHFIPRCDPQGHSRLIPSCEATHLRARVEWGSNGRQRPATSNQPGGRNQHQLSWSLLYIRWPRGQERSFSTRMTSAGCRLA